MRSAFLAACLLAAACSSGGSNGVVRDGERPAQPTPLPSPAPTPPAPAVADGWLLLERHEDTDPTARYRAVFVGPRAEGPLRAAEEIERPALARANWPGHFRTAVAFDGGRFARAEPVATPNGEQARVVVERVDAPSPSVAAITIDCGPDAPTALHLARQTLFVGGTGTVSTADLGEARPSLRVAVTRAGDLRKPYDLFVREGDALLAIDDVVRPVFADLFRLDERGAPTRLADLRLPPMINGHYRAVALQATGPDAWTAFAVLPFGIIDGTGQTLARLRLHDGRVEPGEDVTLNQTGTGPGVLEEFVPRGDPHSPPRLLAGSELTDFRAVAVAPDGVQVLVAADGRGLFVLPPTFERGSHPQVVDVGGACRDVIRVGDRAVALVANGTGGALVVLQTSASGVGVQARHELPRAYDRFVR